MLFNSLEFAVFLPIVFLAYWAIPGGRTRARNLLLIAASYVFYGWWDWRFLGLIVLSSLVDFAVGLAMQRRPRQRRALLGASIAVNLGILGYFKYAGFFLESLAGAFTFLGMPLEAPALDIVLPVGISFYTFQTMSYTIDVYRGQLRPTSDLPAFLAYVSFFPQLVAGPIERAVQLLPQFSVSHRFDPQDARDALRQMLWGLFKKVAVADQAARYVDMLFADPGSYGGAALLLGAVLFSFQIYGDFSGYSDIAIGTARLFGFRLMKNFDVPYFSRDIQEFWRRWHISLSTWFRDYVYVPLGGSRVAQVKHVRNVLIVFLISGLWHGANWTFVMWGAIHAVLFLTLRIRKGPHVERSMRTSPAAQLRDMLATFLLVTLAWVFFRAPDLASALEYLGGVMTLQAGSVPWPSPAAWITIPTMVLVEWTFRERPHPFDLSGLHVVARWACYLLVFLASLGLHRGDTTFIYFQF